VGPINPGVEEKKKKDYEETLGRKEEKPVVEQAGRISSLSSKLSEITVPLSSGWVYESS
jgi:hypothetical protein